MYNFFRITDAELHAIATNRWASPYERAMHACSVMSTCFEVEHETAPKTEVKFDLNQVVLMIEAAVPLEVVAACPTITYGHSILAAVHGFSVTTKRNKTGTTLRYTSTVELMNATFNYRRTTSQFKWFFQSCALGTLAFLGFLFVYGALYGDDEDDGGHDAWEVLDEE